MPFQFRARLGPSSEMNYKSNCRPIHVLTFLYVTHHQGNGPSLHENVPVSPPFPNVASLIELMTPISGVTAPPAIAASLPTRFVSTRPGSHVFTFQPASLKRRS